jgi:branched-chain amino acid transport system ATP-binding protein
MNDNPTTSSPLLSVRRVDVRYGPASALHDVSFDLARGSALAVIGANGAGKTTLARCLAGREAVASGEIFVDGVKVSGKASHTLSRAGIQLVPEGRGIFPRLTVAENLKLFVHRMSTANRKRGLERVFAQLPVLQERRRQVAGTLSGGQQQMLAISRVLANPPRLLIADELSLGLAPIVVDKLFESLASLREDGVSMIIIEQYIERAIGFADSVMILRRGTVAWRGSAADAETAALRHYLGDDSPHSADDLQRREGDEAGCSR